LKPKYNYSELVIDYLDEELDDDVDEDVDDDGGLWKFRWLCAREDWDNCTSHQSPWKLEEILEKITNALNLFDDQHDTGKIKRITRFIETVERVWDRSRYSCYESRRFGIPKDDGSGAKYLELSWSELNRSSKMP
jgi:hypothetical protein